MTKATALDFDTISDDVSEDGALPDDDRAKQKREERFDMRRNVNRGVTWITGDPMNVKGRGQGLQEAASTAVALGALKECAKQQSFRWAFGLGEDEEIAHICYALSERNLPLIERMIAVLRREMLNDLPMIVLDKTKAAFENQNSDLTKTDVIVKPSPSADLGEVRTVKIARTPGGTFIAVLKQELRERDRPELIKEIWSVQQDRHIKMRRSERQVRKIKSGRVRWHQAKN